MELQVALTCGYLLCRIADTVEDHVAVPPERRDELFSTFIAVLEQREAPETFSAPFDAVPGDDAELRLARRIAPVLRVFHAQPRAIQEGTLPWVREMADGMRLFTRRLPGRDGIVALLSTADLERYCYFVAGTVGRMITDLFTESLAAPELHAPLARYCEAFGMGLQMVNILKDVTDDLERSWCFIPRDLCGREGITPAQLADPVHRHAAHAAVAPLFDRAASHLDDALSYTLTIPPDQGRLRLFCLLPLWMAVRTLAIARGNDAMFTPGKPVKISRAEVAKLIAECTFHKGNDEALRLRYAAMRTELDLRASEQEARERAANQLAS
jgi:farnesyl-diphosphate farnesyltransferase